MRARPVTISLAPNTERADAWRALRLLASPWRWRHGPRARILERQLQEFFGISTVALITAGRWGLFLLLRALRLRPGDEVLLQAYTCVSVPGSALWAGLTPRYVDIHPTTLTMDPADLRRKLTPRSRVLLIQHTFGTPAHMAELLEVARLYNLVVIEDCAHTIGARYQGKLAGTFGDAAVLSFGRDKALSSVFGGALLVQRPERFPGLKKELDSLRDAPHSWIFQQLLHPALFVFLIRPLYFVWSIGKAVLVALQAAQVLSKALTSQEKRGGTPAVPLARLPEALANLALCQWDRLPVFNEQRRLLGRTYATLLSRLNVVLPTAPSASDPVPLRYTIQAPNAEEIRREVRHARILLGEWYEIVAPKGTELGAVGYSRGSCPVAELVAGRSLNLPTNPTVSTEDARRVVAAVASLLEPPPFSLLNKGEREGVSPSRRESESESFKIRPILEQEIWDTFVLSLEQKTFLHSWNWLAMNRTLGEDAISLGAFQNGTLVGVALGLTVTARRGSFLFCPHGPLVLGIKNKELGMGEGDIIFRLLGALTAEAKKRNLSFLRVSPLLPDTPERRSLFTARGYRPAPIHMHAETMWVLDVRPPEAELLANMRKTTRNLIRRGEREGVVVRFSTDAGDLAAFQRLYGETAERERFVPFSQTFLDAEFNAFHADDRVFLAFATQDSEPLAAALIVIYGDTAYYHQGASSRARPKVPAAYVLHWRVIEELKRRGIAHYNFWGIAPIQAMGHGPWGMENERTASTRDQAPSPNTYGLREHPWAGLTLFKRGFGGKQVDCLRAQDLPLSKKYAWTYAVESLRRWKRGF